ncbi:MAG: four-carbon acid sugar kinase family protein [Acidobacteria bacterium]|jgi:uncharacterized protein YgbK (DUF1537 family)|nr:four-carbon acid sugar kinase family protein [Acidobacteriota bacterium]
MSEDPRARPLLLGAVADDVSGATDLGSSLTRNGMDVVQFLGSPTGDDEGVEADAIVVALKTRYTPVEQAVTESVEAARWLLARGARQLFFKYSSTFDSTESGNIAPVAEALLDLVAEDLTVVCPADPENERTVYQGHLFVGDRLLSDSGMRHHVLTPMTDPDLVRFLGQQCQAPDAVGLVPFAVVDKGAGAIRASIGELRSRGVRLAVVDAVEEDHLWSAATAVAELRLLTGGSGIARGLPANFRRTDALPQRIEPRFPDLVPPVVFLSGSCSEATRAQVAAMARRHPTLALDPIALAGGRQTVEGVVADARIALEGGVVLIHSTASPEGVEQAPGSLGREQVSHILEKAFGDIVSALVDHRVRTFVVAGGETGEHVAAALGLHRLRIGPEIDPDVPWTLHLGEPAVHVAFKSGDFGSEDFFLKALQSLERS